MGIRMLHRRAAPGRTQAPVYAGKVPSVRPPVPAHAAAASTARIPFDLATLLRRARARAAGPRVPVRVGRSLRRAAAELRHRIGRRDRDAVELWAELALSYLALALTLLPRSRPMPTMTVFIAAEDAVSERAGDRSLRGRRTPGPGATA
ncbi:MULTISPECIES: hypothetical protein [Streptomyces]|uniref:Uncharacterized protein n=1 Tax=Streptomyces sviceus (strain ATCC 29083 / DSM 924 / JCM 4929 / NBRC 13980 / NCIMB 11184 / NRRL 5439 / UC 5370) TaxID=463191 RepID=B5HQN7_STRX2|nr:MULTISPECIES: hypothetical protein [Streptomyces]EDY55142.1 conserved hypothetical protein [Streptomyces sviceus ATCC 29083]MYT05143.1 hypothetical protein [Streptomyces sp. SID5470]